MNYQKNINSTTLSTEGSSDPLSAKDVRRAVRVLEKNIEINRKERMKRIMRKILSIKQYPGRITGMTAE